MVIPLFFFKCQGCSVFSKGGTGHSKLQPSSDCSQETPVEGAVLTGFLSSTSLMLRFSSGMIPLGSLSWTNGGKKESALHRANTWTILLSEILSCTHCGVLEVIQAVVREDEPPPLPGFNSSPWGVHRQCQRDSLSKRKREREKERDKHRGTGSSSRQADRCMGRQTDDGSRELLKPRTSTKHPDAPSHHALATTTHAALRLPRSFFFLTLVCFISFLIWGLLVVVVVFFKFFYN